MKRINARYVVRISRVVADVDRAETFYRAALGFETEHHGHSQAILQLNEAEIALERPAEAGQPYPPDSHSNDLWFQHLAIVVSDMDAAYAHLCQIPGWTPISRNGPQLLPPENGSVRAFKFRDPDGHPLELIWFPGGWRRGRAVRKPALFLGIDHSAVAVASTDRSVEFYTGLGFRVRDGSFNHGTPQSQLDGLEGASVRVTALRPMLGGGPGIELLAYQPPGRPAGQASPNDIAADCITIEAATLFGDRYRHLRDPDGHRLTLVAQGCGLPD